MPSTQVSERVVLAQKAYILFYMRRAPAAAAQAKPAHRPLPAAAGAAGPPQPKLAPPPAANGIARRRLEPNGTDASAEAPRQREERSGSLENGRDATPSASPEGGARPADRQTHTASCGQLEGPSPQARRLR
jgi:hypothetical protein